MIKALVQDNILNVVQDTLAFRDISQFGINEIMNPLVSLPGELGQYSCCRIYGSSSTSPSAAIVLTTKLSHLYYRADPCIVLYASS